MSNFKEKITLIRTMTATFFAKTENEVTENIKRVNALE